MLGRIFAALGHDVIKREPPGGDPLRWRISPVTGQPDGTAFTTINAAKRSISVDPSSDEWDQLLNTADIVIADLAPSQYAEWGLSVETIAQRWPRLVWVSITGFGLDDEHSELPSDSLLAESFGGLATLVGVRDQRPLSLGGEQAAYAAAFSGLLGAMIALLRRAHTHRGDLVDVALCDVAAFMDWKSEVTFGSSGVEPKRADGRGWWRIVRARDGWIGVVYDPGQWNRIVELVDHPRLRDPRLRDQDFRSAHIDSWMPIVEAWAAARTMREAYESAQAVGLPFGYSCDMGVLLEVEQFHERGFLRNRDEVPIVNGPWRIDGVPWITGPAPALGQHTEEVLAQLPDGPPIDVLGTTAEREPLAGVVVLDFGTVTAGAAASRLLADYGATVIKIESPNRPDQFRQWASSTGGAVAVDESLGVIPMFEANNVGKYSLTLDLKDPKDHQRLLDLVPKAHVVLENFRVGVPERLGIGFEDLRTLNPDLLYLSLASQGQTGPESSFASYGSTLDLISGLASVTGYADGPPIWSSYELNYPDQLASLVGGTLVVYCLQQRVRGAHIDLSQRELVTWSLAAELAECAASGAVPRPQGNRRAGAIPHETYPCLEQDSWIAIACHTDAQRRGLIDALGLDVEDQSAETWEAEYARMHDAITRATERMARDECLSVLAAQGVPCVPVLAAAERSVTEHFSRRRVFVTSPGGVRVRGFPFVLRSHAPQLTHSAPRLGADNDRIDEVIDAAGREAELGVAARGRP